MWERRNKGNNQEGAGDVQCQRPGNTHGKADGKVMEVLIPSRGAHIQSWRGWKGIPSLYKLFMLKSEFLVDCKSANSEHIPMTFIVNNRKIIPKVCNNFLKMYIVTKIL